MHRVARRVPGLTRNPEHRALAGAGIADDTADPARIGDMLEGPALLGREHHAARLGARESAVAMPVGHAVMALGIEADCLPFKPLLGLQHRARGEAVLAASVLAQLHQLGRGLHYRHDLVELLLSLAVAVDEHGKVAVGERRLLVRDRIERDVRGREQLLAIGPCNGVVLVEAFAFQALVDHARSGRADLVLRLQLDALRFQRAVIDARVDIELGQPGVDVLSPGLAPVGEQLCPVPVAHLRAETLFGHFAQTEHHMGVRFGEPIGSHIPVHIEIGDHAAIDELALHEVARQFDAVGLVHLARDGELDLARELRVLSLLGGLDVIPQPFAVMPFVGCMLGEQDFGMDDAGLVGEVVATFQPLVVKP